MENMTRKKKKSRCNKFRERKQMERSRCVAHRLLHTPVFCLEYSELWTAYFLHKTSNKPHKSATTVEYECTTDT